MKELVGNCTSCNREVVCMDGFLNGVIAENGKLYCFNCESEKEK